MTPAKILKLMPVFCLALFFTLGEVFAYEPEVMRASGVFLLAGLGIALLALRSRDGPSPVDITIFYFYLAGCKRHMAGPFVYPKKFWPVLQQLCSMRPCF